MSMETDHAAVLELSEKLSPPAQSKKWSQWLRTALSQFLVICISATVILISLMLYAVLTKSSPSISSAIFELFWPILPVTLAVVGVGLCLSWAIGAGLSRLFAGLGRNLFPRSDASPAPNELPELIGKRGQLKPDEFSAAGRLATIREIDGRVTRLGRRASAVLLTMSIALIGAVLVVIFAGRLTSLDASAVSTLDRLRNERSEINARLAALLALQNSYERVEKARQELTDSKLKQDAFDEIQDREARLQRGFYFGNIRVRGLSIDLRDPPDSFLFDRQPPQAFGDLASTKQMVLTEEDNAKRIDGLIYEAWKAELIAGHDNSNWRYIIATAITRVGVVLLIVFLVQILMGLYRYNSRLVTYYQSRRDLLTLWDGNTALLRALNKVLTPPRIDFGKEPKHPLEDLIKAAARQAGDLGRRSRQKDAKLTGAKDE